MVKKMIIIVLLIFINTARAAELSATSDDEFELNYQIEEEFDKCVKDDAKNYSTRMMNCYYDAADAWEKEIDRLFKLSLKEQKDETIKSALIMKQKSWVKYKEAYFKALDKIYTLQEVGTAELTVSASIKMNFLLNKAAEFTESY
ncbi:lysozyme inhibitor LprI family protein [Serratia sp. DD3]|uniref:lysozyme inhibitor LprI family protein n=1 Tax=Serratia sp. DD3 TaxID=1410619 RepID=UPI0004D37E50|nr:lysozyme inhibitor LprI family protein [Serratia sp. DD3]KEY56962.1 hypothetical protein SRDD_42110 [Serratia sp. DD3]